MIQRKFASLILFRIYVVTHFRILFQRPERQKAEESCRTYHWSEAFQYYAVQIGIYALISVEGNGGKGIQRI